MIIVETVKDSSMEKGSPRVFAKTTKKCVNTANEIKQSIYQDISIRFMLICFNKKIPKTFSPVPNIQTTCGLQIGFQKVDNHVGGKWLIHRTKSRTENQLLVLLRYNAY